MSRYRLTIVIDSDDDPSDLLDALQEWAMETLEQDEYLATRTACVESI